MDFATWLASKTGASLKLLHVIDDSDVGAWSDITSDREVGAFKETLQARLEENIGALQAAHPTLKVAGSLRSGRVVDVILKEADAPDTRFIVCGGSGKTQSAHIFFGSTASHLIRASAKPVFVVPTGFKAGEMNDILAPIDGSISSRAILKLTGELAGAFDVKVRIVHSIPRPQYLKRSKHPEETDASAKSLIAEREALIGEIIETTGIGESVAAVSISEQSPETAIRTFVEVEKTRMVCLGTHGQQGFKRYFLGSTAERILRALPCVVVVLRDTTPM